MRQCVSRSGALVPAGRRDRVSEAAAVPDFASGLCRIVPSTLAGPTMLPPPEVAGGAGAHPHVVVSPIASTHAIGRTRARPTRIPVGLEATQITSLCQGHYWVGTR